MTTWHTVYRFAQGDDVLLVDVRDIDGVIECVDIEASSVIKDPDENDVFTDRVLIRFRNPEELRKLRDALLEIYEKWNGLYPNVSLDTIQ